MVLQRTLPWPYNTPNMAFYKLATFNLIQNYKTTTEVMEIIAQLHSTDKSVVIEAFAPIKQLSNPTTYALAFQNAKAILRTADILKSIEIEEAVELAELDLRVKKGIHD